MSIHSLCKHSKKQRTKSWTMRILSELSLFCRTKMHLVSSFIQQCGQRKCLLIHSCCKTNCGPCQQRKRSIFRRQELSNGIAQHPSNKLGISRPYVAPLESAVKDLCHSCVSLQKYNPSKLGINVWMREYISCNRS